MLNKSRLLTIGIGVTALAGALLSFTQGNDEGKKKKYHVIHQKDGVLSEYDTIVPMTSTYTVENFLADKGIENTDVEIINVPSMGDNHFIFKGDGVEGEHHVMIKEFKHDMMVDGDSMGSKEVKIMREIGEDGEMVTKKWVNGEEVELTQEDLENIEKHQQMRGEHVVIKMDVDKSHEHKMVFITEGEEGDNIEIEVEIDDKGNKIIKKTVNGEEVEMTEEELLKLESDNHRMHEGAEGQQMIIDIREDEMSDHEMVFITEGEEGDNIEIKVEIDDKGNKIIKKTVNGVEVEMTEEELNKMEFESHHGGHHGNKMMFHMDDSDMTDEEKEAVMQKLKEEMAQMTIDIDSLHEFMDIELETILEDFHGEDGEVRVIVKSIEMDGDNVNYEGHHGRHMRKMVHSDGEDFTIVLVTENLSTDGESSFQNERGMATNDMMVFPNPNDGVFTIQFEQSEKMKTKVEIRDAQGKVVFEDKLGKFSGTYNKEVDLKEYGSGMYLISIQQGKSVITNKIIVN